MRLLRGLAAASLALVTGVIGSAAHAEPPVDVTGQITDPQGVLGDRTDEVQTALDDYFEATRSQLFVVFVDSFDGQDGQDWATASATRSNLGAGDILLAVATGDRAFGYSVDDRFPLTDDQLRDVEREEILPELRAGDWAGAAIAAARGYQAASEGGDVPWIPIGLGGAAVVGVGAYAVHRIRSRYDSTHVVRDEHGEPVDPLSTLSTEQLDLKCGSALVAVDDALKSSEQELAYAEAQFGKEATRPFTEALAEAHETVKAAFGLRQRLDDDEPESETEHRRLAAEIIRLCEKADQTLDEQVEAFDHLRDLQAKAPEVIEDMVGRVAEVERRIPSSQAVLELLQRNHPATDLASVSGNVVQAQRLLADALDQCEQGRQAIAADDRATAVVRARAAEGGVSQATTLLDAIDRAEQDLAAAPGLITDRLSSIGQDVVDAERLAPQDPAVTTAVEAAREAITYAGRDDRDPLAAARHLQDAEAQLDDLLGPARAAAAEAEKARTALADSIGRVTSRIAGVTDYVTTRRGAVGPDARTRLSEATRHLERARQLAEVEPTKALDEVRAAEQQVDEAESIARRDVDRWERAQQPPSSAGDGMILGGILSGGSGRSRSSSSWGGSSSRRSSSRRSSSRRSSSRRSSSSRGSRGRRGGGGRF